MVLVCSQGAGDEKIGIRVSEDRDLYQNIWWNSCLSKAGQVSSKTVMLGEEVVKDCHSEPGLLQAAFSKVLEE